MKNFKIIIASLLLVGLFSFSWPSKLDKKVKATISKTYKLKHYDLTAIRVEASVEKITERKVNDCLFAIKSASETEGYIYVGEAPSMKNVFDYAILLSEDLEIVNTKVLIYREKHGRQIGMKRWLKQFFGMTSKDRPTLGYNVDGISGATISATSMTNSVREVLSTIEYLKRNNKL